MTYTDRYGSIPAGTRIEVVPVFGEPQRQHYANPALYERACSQWETMRRFYAENGLRLPDARTVRFPFGLSRQAGYETREDGAAVGASLDDVLSMLTAYSAYAPRRGGYEPYGPSGYGVGAEYSAETKALPKPD